MKFVTLLFDPVGRNSVMEELKVKRFVVIQEEIVEEHFA